MDPSTIHRAARSSSTISDTVLRCSCEARARSARDIGCLVRIRLKIRFRLISRGILFDALCLVCKREPLRRRFRHPVSAIDQQPWRRLHHCHTESFAFRGRSFISLQRELSSYFELRDSNLAPFDEQMRLLDRRLARIILFSNLIDLIGTSICLA